MKLSPCTIRASATLVALLLASPCAQAFYNPELARWLNRDPINELGFNHLVDRQQAFHLQEEKNLYDFVANAPISKWDHHGLVIDGHLDVLLDLSSVCCNLASGYRTRNEAARRGVNIGDETYGGNAYLHCVAACRANKACVGAKKYWDGRETAGTLEGDMDLANNAVGYGIQGDCWQGCADAWRTGSLTCINVNNQLSPCRGNLPPGL